jgi:hypothetical protein
MRISRAVIAGVVMVTAARGLAIAAVSDRPGTAIESSRCPHPSVGWSQKALLPIVKGPDFEGVVLPPKAARAVLCQCSRKSLGPASGYWTPTLSELLPMEARLPDYLRAHAHPRRPDQWRELKGYLRQYLGIARAGRRLIYINGIGGPVFSPARRISHRPAIERAWRSTALVMCDGGADYFGAEYDVAAREFTRIDFNHSF